MVLLPGGYLQSGNGLHRPAITCHKATRGSDVTVHAIRPSQATAVALMPSLVTLQRGTRVEVVVAYYHATGLFGRYVSARVIASKTAKRKESRSSSKETGGHRLISYRQTFVT